MQPFNLMLMGVAGGHKSPRVIATLIGNLIPAVCVLLFGWSVFALMILYWLENLAVGLFNLLKMIMEGATRGFPGIVAAIFACPFFTFHYGMFCTIHGIFVWSIFSQGERVAPLDGLNPLELFQHSLDYVRGDGDVGLNLIALFGVQLFQFIEWLWRGRWTEAEPLEQMVKPYGRIVVLHLTILGGAVPVLLMGQPVLAVFLLALLKTVIEVAGAARTPKTSGAAPVPAQLGPS
ncbi:MAG: DUF6498-containing protein [Caulobacteraceae bacterium]